MTQEYDYEDFTDEFISTDLVYEELFLLDSWKKTSFSFYKLIDCFFWRKNKLVWYNPEWKRNLN